MFLNVEEEKELLQYAKEIGCTVYLGYIVPVYKNTEKALVYLQDENYWCIVLNSTVILGKISDIHYHRSSILVTPEHNSHKFNHRPGTVPMEKYNCGVELDKMKKYLKHQVENLPKLKKRQIKIKIEQIETDFN